MDAQETSIYHAIIITSVVIGIIIVFFIYSLIRHQRKNLELHRMNILAEITVLEKERARIASDLHDELGPLLAAVRMKINSFELVNEDDQLQVELTSGHIDAMLMRVREISLDLMPGSLIRKGLIVAIKEFIDYLNQGNEIQFIFRCEKDFPVNEQKAINIYRMVQELAHNAIKHSGASSFSVSIEQVKKMILITVSDDGSGFDYESAAAGTMGFGLRGLLSRTEIIGGQMFLESKPGKGTTYNFEIPL